MKKRLKEKSYAEIPGRIDIPPHLVNESYRSRVKREQILERSAVLTKIFLRVKGTLLGVKGYEYDEISKLPGIYLNDPLLLHRIKSYWYDILRFKDFHASGADKLINKPKGPLTQSNGSWSRSQSFVPNELPDPVQRHLAMRTNEIFAFRTGLEYAEIPLKLIEYGAPDGDLADEFSYNLAFRGVDVGFLSLWFETVLHFHGLPVE